MACTDTHSRSRVPTIVGIALLLLNNCYCNISPKKLFAVASRVHHALTSVLSHHITLRQALVEDVGVSIKEVRVSPDHTKAFILWDSYTGESHRASQVLKRSVSQLRAAVGKALGSKLVPRLEFRRDVASAEEVELMKFFDGMERKRREGTGTGGDW